MTLPFNPYELFKDDLNMDKVQVANLILNMQNNALLKMLMIRATSEERPNDILTDYDSQLAEIWANIMPQLDKNNDKDLEI